MVRRDYEPFHRYPVAAYNNLTRELNIANNMVNRGHQLTHDARINMHQIRAELEAAANSPDFRHRFALTRMLNEAERDVNRLERLRLYFRRNYLRLLRKQRAIARRRLLFMHRSGRAPWRGAGPP